MAVAFCLGAVALLPLFLLILFHEARWLTAAQGSTRELFGAVLPLVPVYAALGVGAERTARPWFSRPQYLAAAAAFIVVLELLALDGRALQHIGGFSLAPWQSPDVNSPRLLDTVAAMTVNGALFYAAASLLIRHGTALSGAAAQFLFVVAPFALLHPLGYLVRTGEYSLRWDWLYAGFALAITLLSQRRQRRSFYYAGLLNLGGARGNRVLPSLPGPRDR